MKIGFFSLVNLIIQSPVEDMIILRVDDLAQNSLYGPL